MTWWSFSRYRCDIYLSNFSFSSLSVFSFSPIWFLNIKREWCFAGHVILPEHNCRCFSLAVFLFFERGVGFPGDGEWPHHFTFLHICPPPPLFPASHSVCVSLSLARASQAGSGSLRAQHTDADSDRLVWLFLFHSSPFSPGRQSSRPADCCR